MSELVKTGKVRFSYANVFEPKAPTNGGEAKYSITLLIPKTDVTTKQAIDNAILVAINEGVTSAFNGVRPTNPKLPVHDGDGIRPNGEPFGEECKGHWVITANSKQKPGIVDRNLNEIMSKDEFYSGCYGRATIRFYAYNQSGSKGIGCGLNNLQKLEDGPMLSGRTLAKDDFADTPVQNQPAVNPITGQPIVDNIMGV